MRVRIFVEGGGNTRELKTRCRDGFRQFFVNAGLDHRLLAVFPGGARTEAYKSFKHEVESGRVGDLVVLLVDAEAPVGSPSVWIHLRSQDGWARPDRCGEDNAHLMVQCMEAWFLADPDALALYFGRGFNARALPKRSNIEETPMVDIEASLRNATQRSSKGRYNKGRHSFDVLARLDPQKVLAAAPHAKRLIEVLRRHC